MFENISNTGTFDIHMFIILQVQTYVMIFWQQKDKTCSVSGAEIT